jgi:hypothetical protein
LNPTPATPVLRTRDAVSAAKLMATERHSLREPMEKVYASIDRVRNFFRRGPPNARGVPDVHACPDFRDRRGE